MPQLNPYLNFDGNCREAMTFYAQCLGGKVIIQTAGESPMATELAQHKDKVMHANIMKDGKDLLMASDAMMHEYKQGTNFSVSVNCTSDEEIRTLFANFSKGATITQPLTDAFWGATFGMLTDKFGINWMFNYQKPEVKK